MTESFAGLQTFFMKNPRVALGFSGGVDSSYLLYAGIASGAEVRPYFIETAFQPQFERDDAKRLAAEVGAALTVLPLDVLANEIVAQNPQDRCYHCKRALFGALKERAEKDSFPLLIDGTNASDDAGDRPGMRALEELQVRSPLRECGITKTEVRAFSRAAGLFTWDKPAYACLATRVPAGERITAEILRRVEGAETALFAMGYTDFRVRVMGGAARLQLPAAQMERAAREREAALAALKPYFDVVLLDMAGRP